MPRTTKHRGADPEDDRSFGAVALPTLRQAVGDLCWLLDRGYGLTSATELVGDRHHATRRQRIAIAHCACSSDNRDQRASRAVSVAQIRNEELWLDGFNVLTAVETALGGGVILIGLDGCCRDVAGVYSHYHRVEETVPALCAIGQCLWQHGVLGCRWWLDRPVDNSGRLQSMIQDVAREHHWRWAVELVMNPDRVLSNTERIVCTSDHAILDRCQHWFNLTRQVLHERVPQVRMVDLESAALDAKNDV